MFLSDDAGACRHGTVNRMMRTAEQYPGNGRMNKETVCEDKTENHPENTGPLTLLETGRRAFPEILRQIRSARQEILIHMFIWREDRTGTAIAEELLAAADRGVLVVIEKDRYGLILEYAEESQRSFCHSPDLPDRIKIKTLCLTYNRHLYGNRLHTERSALYRKLKEHPNVLLRDSRKTKDHSKYYIFDRKIMILGGINIEDKEYFTDSAGRVYYDWMVRISDPDIVSRFPDKRACPQKKHDLFRINTREPVRRFELKESFLELIDSTEHELIIMMAYFSPEKDIVSAIYRALDRGAKVRILISRSANYNNDTNRYTVSRLLGSRPAKRSGKLSVFMTDCMLHAKLIMNEKQIITGSCNITPKSFRKLGELCIAVRNDDSPFACQIRACAEEVFRTSAPIESRADLCFNYFLALLEAAVMR